MKFIRSGLNVFELRFKREKTLSRSRVEDFINRFKSFIRFSKPGHQKVSGLSPRLHLLRY